MTNVQYLDDFVINKTQNAPKGAFCVLAVQL
jgi:hypothetical protein